MRHRPIGIGVQGLADALVKLCHGHRLVLQGLKFGAAERGKETWRENWRATAAPLFAETRQSMYE